MNKKGGDVLRILLGCYLVFIGTSLWIQVSKANPNNERLMVLASVVMIVAGLAYGLFSLKRITGFSFKFMKKRTDRGAQDETETSESAGVRKKQDIMENVKLDDGFADSGENSRTDEDKKKDEAGVHIVKSAESGRLNTEEKESREDRKETEREKNTEDGKKAEKGKNAEEKPEKPEAHPEKSPGMPDNILSFKRGAAFAAETRVIEKIEDLWIAAEGEAEEETVVQEQDEEAENVQPDEAETDQENKEN